MKTEAYTNDQKRVLKVANDNPDASPKEVADILGDPTIGSEYCNEIMENFRLPDETSRQFPTESNLLQQVKEESEGIPEDDTPEWAQPLDDPESFEPARRKVTYSTLDQRTKRLIDYINANPDATRKDIEHEFDTNPGTLSGLIRSHSHLIDEGTSVFHSQAKRPEDFEWDDLGESHQKVVRTINAHPDKTASEIGEMVGLGRQSVNQYAGITPQFITREAEPQFDRLGEPEEVDDSRVSRGEDGRPVLDHTEQYITERPAATADELEAEAEQVIYATDPEPTGEEIVEGIPALGDGDDPTETVDTEEREEALRSALDASPAEEEPETEDELVGYAIAEDEYADLTARANAFDQLVGEIELMRDQAAKEASYLVNDSANLRKALLETLCDRAAELTDDE